MKTKYLRPIKIIFCLSNKYSVLVKMRIRPGYFYKKNVLRKFYSNLENQPILALLVWFAEKPCLLTICKRTL